MFKKLTTGVLMMILELILFFLLLIGGFYIIIKTADFFIDEAATIGKSFGMSKVMIGLTIVAIGTSLPEAITSLSSILFTPEYSDFIIGTTLGSNLTNILLVFGIFLVLSGNFKIRKNLNFDTTTLLVTSSFMSIFILLGYSNRFAIAILIFYVGYLIYLAKFNKSQIIKSEEELVDIKKEPRLKSYVFLVLSIAGLMVGARIVIYCIENIGIILSVPPAYLTLTTISIATSLPELAVIISSFKKNEHLIGIGNIVGTNIMNIGIIFGVSGFYGFYVINTELYYYSLAFFTIGILLFSYMLLTKRFSRNIGYVLIGLYLMYLGSFFL